MSEILLYYEQQYDQVKSSEEREQQPLSNEQSQASHSMNWQSRLNSWRVMKQLLQACSP